jgi:hypothetical protein
MEERRRADRYVVSFPIRVEWKDESGEKITEDGLTENVGLTGTLIHLPRQLPKVGSEVKLTVSEDPKNEVTVPAQVLRLERNAAHPQVALMLLDKQETWKKKVWEYAYEVVSSVKPDDFDDWN